MNPHKMMMVPLDCSLFYTAHPELLRNAFSLSFPPDLFFSSCRSKWSSGQKSHCFVSSYSAACRSKHAVLAAKSFWIAGSFSLYCVVIAEMSSTAVLFSNVLKLPHGKMNKQIN